MSVDPVEAIADAQVEFLNGSKAEWDDDLQPELEFEATKEYDPSELLARERLGPVLVMVVPYGEVAEKIGRKGQSKESYQTNLIVVRKIEGDFTMPALSLFTRQLVLALRKESRMAGYYWLGDETVTRYDPQVLRELGQFAAVRRLTYSGTA